MPKEISLKEHQRLMLEILIVFKEFCEKHNLAYYLDAGTLLGAIRHKGFIPWDNDMDICMPRSDYNKFITIMSHQNNHINDHIILQKSENTMYCYSKIGDLRTQLIEFQDKTPMDNHVYIDVFPKDGIHKLSKTTKLLCKLSYILLLFHWFNKFSIFYWKQKKSGIKKFIATIANKITTDYNWAYKLQTRLIAWYSKKHPYSKCSYVTTLVNGEFHKCAPIECFSEQITVSFEGLEFKAPIGYDTYLRILYPGDYMQPPPPEKRGIHQVIVRWR